MRRWSPATPARCSAGSQRADRPATHAATRLVQDATALRSRPLRAEFDWLAFVVVQPDGSRSYYITPRDVCDQCSLIFPKVARTNPDGPHWREISFGTALRVMAPFLGNAGPLAQLRHQAAALGRGARLLIQINARPGSVREALNGLACAQKNSQHNQLAPGLGRAFS
jgi:hypothetical protein